MSNLVTFQQQEQNCHGKRNRYKLPIPNLVSNSMMCVKLNFPHHTMMLFT